MAITYTLAPMPKWVVINNEGTVAGGAKLYTYSSLNKIQPKTVWMDSAGTITWTNPIIFDLNGTQGPFFWEFDSAQPDELYYLVLRDSAGNVLWTMDDYGPGSGGGGGGNVTTYLPLYNYISNNQFIDHIPDNAGPLPVNLVVAPSNHKGFTPAVANPITSTFGVVGPDIRFVKNNTNATDNLTFPLFFLGTDSLAPDVTPVDYVRYQCTAVGLGGELYKAFQFPITQKVKNLANKQVTFRMWARVESGTDSIEVSTIQYFGSGTGASATVRTVIGTALSLTTAWTLFTTHFTVPAVAGKSIGTPTAQTDDDALYIHVEMPLSAVCDIQFTKPALYLGTISPDEEFENYDEIYSTTMTARTGDVRTSYVANATGMPGWLLMEDKSIGNTGSGATGRTGADCFALYKTIWDSVLNTWAPVSGGPSRGASALIDFLAGRTLTLPRTLGRALAEDGSGAGLTTRDLGEWLGAETVQLVNANMPLTVPVSSAVTGSHTVAVAGAGVNVPGGAGVIWTQGSDTAVNKMQPTTFMNFYIKL